MKNTHAHPKKSGSPTRGDFVLVLASSILVFVLGLSAYIVLYRLQIPGLTLYPFLAVMVAAVAFAVGGYAFVTRFYKPVLQIDKAFEIIESGDIGRLINFNLETGKNAPTSQVQEMLMQLEKIANRDYSETILIKQAELTALQSQINPHFLYNTLECIRGQALMENMNQIAEMTEALSTFFRYSISTKGNFVTLHEELENVQNYMLIQQYRFNNKFSLRLEYSDNYDTICSFMLPKLTLQPIVENAIFHGLEPKIGHGSIVIRIVCTARRLILIVKDDGIGMSKETLDQLNTRLRNGHPHVGAEESKHTGIALTNVNERIRLYFGGDYGVTVSSTQSLFTDVTVVLPIMKEGDRVSLNGAWKLL